MENGKLFHRSRGARFLSRYFNLYPPVGRPKVEGRPSSLFLLLTMHVTVNRDAYRNLHPQAQTALFGGGNNVLRDRFPL